MSLPPDQRYMRRAIELARRGEGCVEPNPMVGCVIVRDDETIAEGWHERFGGPHAEIHALQKAGDRARGATAYVSLEPCCHHGKTPPCSDALLAAGVSRVVIAMADPFPQVDGGGAEQLRAAGVDVTVGIAEAEARRLNAPYLKLVERGRPWVIAKWAMTLDGRIATRTGDSQWISGAASRAIVHRLRGRVDGILVGRGTAEADDPLLTARPPQDETPRRVAARIVVDSQASLARGSRLVQTAAEAPVLVVAGPAAPAENVARLREAGCEVLRCESERREERLEQLLDELGRRRMTNVLVEGGAGLLGSLFDAGAVDEVHVFIAPKIVGGAAALSPIGGGGIAEMNDALSLEDVQVERTGDDLYVRGRLL